MRSLILEFEECRGEMNTCGKARKKCRGVVHGLPKICGAFIELDKIDRK